ncbi:hypothetical protein [Streptomyces sp. NPDC055036]
MATPTTEEFVQAALAAEEAAPFRAIGTPNAGPYGWRIVVTRIEDGTTVLDLDYPEWSDWRAASAGHRLIEHGYMVSQPSHFHPERVGGWAVEPGGKKFTASVYSRDHYVGPAPDAPEKEDQEEPDVQEELTATLWIDSHTSVCGNCKQGAFMDDSHHTRIAGGWEFRKNGKPGCGAEFVRVASSRLEYSPEDLRRIRPGLPVREPHQGNPRYSQD